MLTLHYGRTGSGKTYSLVRFHILPHMEAGGRLVTNVDGFQEESVLEYWAKWLSISLDDVRTRIIYLPFAAVKTFRQVATDGDLLAIDEAQKFWPSVAGHDQDDFMWFTECRRKGVDVHLVTQDFRNLNPAIRRIGYRCFSYRKMQQYALLPDALATLGLPTKSSYKVSMHDADEPRGKPIEQKYQLYKKEFFPLYRSQIGQGQASKLKSIWLQPKMFVFFALLVFALYRVANMYDARKKKDAPQTEKPQQEKNYSPEVSSDASCYYRLAQCAFTSCQIQMSDYTWLVVRRIYWGSFGSISADGLPICRPIYFKGVERSKDDDSPPSIHW